jgi:DNA-directed RNA polymerase subunit F
LRELFDDPTVSGVCKVIEKEQAEQASSEVSKVAEALKQIESLSDEEAKRLLEELRSGSSK